MNLVMSISDDVNVLSFGRKIASGPPARCRRIPAVIEAYLGSDDEHEDESEVAPRGAHRADTRRETGVKTLLELDGVAARYGPVQALHDVSLVVREGEVVAVLGANGAGKTTTLRAISGTVSHDPARSSSTASSSRAGRKRQRGRHRARARGPRHVRRPHRDGEPQARRVHPPQPLGEGGPEAHRRVLPVDDRARRASAPERSRAASSRCSRSAERS